MKLKINPAVLLILVILACSNKPTFFIGKWQIVSIVENNESIDFIDNWMHLKQDGTFESYDGSLKKHESGLWSYQPDEKRLFIDGAGEKGDSEWKLSFKNDTLIFHAIPNDTYLIAHKIIE